MIDTEKDRVLMEKHNDAVDRFRTEICECSAEIDPTEELDWFSLSHGFFLAQGINYDDSYNLSRIVRYQHQYWQ